jgi:hypothetical protein
MSSRIKNFKQFNESIMVKTTESLTWIDVAKPSDLDLNKIDVLKVKEKVNKEIYSMSESEKEDVFNEIEKMIQTLGCTIEDLTNPIFVKEHLDELTMRNNIIEEGFFTDIKDKIINILAKIFEWGTAIGSILTIVVSSLGGSFIGVMTGAIALTISILASAYIYNKINK